MVSCYLRFVPLCLCAFVREWTLIKFSIFWAVLFEGLGLCIFSYEGTKLLSVCHLGISTLRCSDWCYLMKAGITRVINGQLLSSLCASVPL
jgi:hypothetical protein